MGNRGCLHDEHQQLTHLYKSKAWIFCKLQFKGNRRTIMFPNHYTELFFLDEATALSAGHRPCAQCMRDRYNEFRSYWVKANADLVDSSCFNAVQLDKILHSERISSDKQKSTYTEHLNALPVGSFVLLEPDASPCLVLEEALLVWTPGGYTQQLKRPKTQQVTVLTPRSIVQMLRAGFRPHLHDSAAQLPIAKQLKLTVTV
ncbi:MAG TPA: hypothetical protein V6C84_30985 [Coleofasciculaceae cyanobacterium]